MNFLSALELIRCQVLDGTIPRKLFLACGFTPVYLPVFINAELIILRPGRKNEIKSGLFGDLLGNIQRGQTSDCESMLATVEWPDIDPRLGIRTLGGWRISDLPSILFAAEQQLARLSEALAAAAQRVPIALSFPTLPLPPLFYTRNIQATSEEVRLQEMVAACAAHLVTLKNVRLVNSESLLENSPFSSRFDVKSEIVSGFPYSLSHASILAGHLAALIANPTPRKGVITDLDDTLWGGILGEVGVEGVSWSLDQHTHMHALYQQFLASLASAGTLIAVASKNDPALVEKAFARKDLFISKDSIFPFEVHWNPKSDSVRRILQDWNISPDTVVFIDDSPMEVAEVKAAFPQMECLVFPRENFLAIWELLKKLRNDFGKASLSEEDALRLQSLRNSKVVRQSLGSVPNADEFLKGSEAHIHFASLKHRDDPRALELVNKTNQFNLNGKRLTEGEWSKYLADPSSVALLISYRDKFGPLGKISVLLGRLADGRIQVDCWVMSCRAFSRRIEHQCVNHLFRKYNPSEISFDFKPTDRNGPLQEFFAELLGSAPSPPVTFSRTACLERLPKLFHRVEANIDE
jgi:FkbH-like protein